jgi:hypothetical protein
MWIVSGEASLAFEKAGPFDPALRDLRMNRAAARFTSFGTPRWVVLDIGPGARWISGHGVPCPYNCDVN